MEPAWLKKLQTTHSSTPPKKSRKPSKSRDGSAEKENSKESKIPTKAKKMAEQQNAEEAHKPSEPLEKAKKGKKSQKPEKATKEAARGRNAGVTVVPIGEKVLPVHGTALLSRCIFFWPILYFILYVIFYCSRQKG